MNPRAQALLNRIEEALRDNEEPAPTAILAKLAGVPKQAVEDVLSDPDQGSIVSLGAAGWALRDWVMAIFGGVQVTFGEEPFGPKEVRQELGVSRRIVMDLLDYWVAEGLVERGEAGWRCLILPSEQETEP